MNKRNYLINLTRIAHEDMFIDMVQTIINKKHKKREILKDEDNFFYKLLNQIKISEESKIEIWFEKFKPIPKKVIKKKLKK